ncbi:MAG: M20 family metallopeptidase, partial [Clostridia bacterium]|nr:M20 family metallopeptidase [Clostridia bacterium]
TFAGDKSNALLSFPAAGCVYGKGLRNGGAYGRYWSSSLYSVGPGNAYNLYQQHLDRSVTQNDIKLCSVSLPKVTDAKTKQSCELLLNVALTKCIYGRKGPVTEPLKYDYRSEHEGMMHACGHDMHTTILLGAGKWLNAHRDLMKGNVRLLFQPAEETDGGAKPMVEAGVMEGVDRVFGQHVQPYMNVGVIDGMRGTLNASTDEVRITVHGVSCHAARPEGGVDAIVCAGAMISSLQTVVSRSVTPLKPSVLTFGTINGGRARNIVCDCVELGGTLRTADPVLRETMKRRIREVAEGVAAAYGAKVDVEIISGFDALINDDHEIDRLMRLGRELLGDANVLTREAPSMGGEDFSYFCEAVPGAFYHLGCGKQQPAPTLHSCDFDPDEKCMAIGVAMQCAAALDVMNEMH